MFEMKKKNIELNKNFYKLNKKTKIPKNVLIKTII
jgi:hypothetical protein